MIATKAQRIQKQKKRINLFMGTRHVRNWGARVCTNKACAYRIAFGPVCKCGTPTVEIETALKSA